MPTVNHFFNNFKNTGEQRLVEDLIIESIRIFGLEVHYLPRTIVDEDVLFGEDTLSIFKNAFPLEMYVKNTDGFEGEGDFLTKFGVQNRDEITFTVSRRRFGEEVPVADTPEEIGRPSEGDLVYFPLSDKIFEVKFIEHEDIFYQFGALQTYDLTCELFEYSHERIETGVANIDDFEKVLTGDTRKDQIVLETGASLFLETGDAVIGEEFHVGNNDNSADNDYFEAQAEEIIEPESSPFSLGDDF